MSIVVAFTPSAQGRAALNAGLAQARRTSDHLIVAAHQYHDPDSGRMAADEAEIRRALDELEGHDVDVTVIQDSEQEAGDFLLTTAEEQQASCIVIGLRRKSPIGKLSLGAAARRVVLGSPCPVLTVKDGLPNAS